MSEEKQQQLGDEEIDQDPYASDFIPPDADDVEDEEEIKPIDTQSVMDGEAFDPVEAVIDNAPKSTDDSFPRWGMSGLLPIPLFQQNGNNSFGDFNRKNEKGQNIVNHTWFPPFQIVPLYGGTFRIPYENKPSESEDPIAPEPFDYSAFMKQPKDGHDRIVRTAKQCAEVFVVETGRSGSVVIESLTGYHVSDPDKGLGAVRQLIDIIMPIRDRAIFPEKIRVKNGIPFKGPFLDEILAYVTANGVKNVMESRLSSYDKEIGMRVAVELRTKVLLRGMQMANTILNETEAEMKKADGIKKTYDAPNLEVEDAPVSTDSYCLAHTDRVELDDKQLQASATIGSELAAPMTSAMESLERTVERVAALGAPQHVGNSMSIEEVQDLLDKQAKALEERFEARIKAATAGGGGTDPEGEGSKGGGKKKPAGE